MPALRHRDVGEPATAVPLLPAGRRPPEAGARRAAATRRRRDRLNPTDRVPSARKRKFSKWVAKRLVNPFARLLLERGLMPRTHALLETKGRKSGLPRRVPIGNGLRDGVFWIVTEHGYHADYVRNIQHDPRVRVKVGRSWHSGTAHILSEDDPRERMRALGRPVNDALVRLVGSEQLVVRIDLDH